MPEYANTYRNVFVPEVAEDIIEEKIDKQLKLTKYAKVDNTLVGKPGDKIKTPAYVYIGDARKYGEGEQLDASALRTYSTEVGIEKFAAMVKVPSEMFNNTPAGKADILRQLAKSIAGGIERDLNSKAYGASTRLDRKSKKIGYDVIVDMSCAFLDEEYDVEKVLFIHPLQEADVLKDPVFSSADRYEKGVTVRGSIGKLASGCHVVKTLNVPYIKYVEATSSDTGALQVIANPDSPVDNNGRPVVAESGKVFQKDCINTLFDSENQIPTTPAIGDYVKANSAPYFINAVVKLEEDSEDTEADFPALKILEKKNVEFHEFYIVGTDEYVFSAVRHAGTALTNDARVALAMVGATDAA